MMRRALPAFALLIALVWALPAASRPHARASAASKAYSAAVTYTQTDKGTSDNKDVRGKGTFSIRLGRIAQIAAIGHIATGVPYGDIAKGGSFKVRYDYTNSGTKGATLVKFKEKSLGSVCVTYAFKEGKYTPGSSFVPSSGTLEAAGGTKKAATLAGKVSFDQTDLSGAISEIFVGKGAASLHTAKAKKPAKACKSL